MAKCRDPLDWTILPTGHGTGSVACGDFRGWYTRNAQGRVQISWTEGADKERSPEIDRAATTACEQADDGRQTSKAGRIDAGG